MENKYYTPSIEEFFVGFEFEHRDPYYEGREEFQEAVIETSELVRYYNSQDKLFNYWEAEHLLSNILWDIEHKNTRVKYLDKDDIESFGFRITKDLSYEISAQTIIDEDKYEFYELDYDFEDKELIIERFYQSKMVNKLLDPNTFSSHILFQGKVKNKSELKTVLQMIGVL